MHYLFFLVCFALVSLVCGFFFGRVRTVGVSLPTAERPVLFIGLRKKGVADEWAASFVLRRPFHFFSPRIGKSSENPPLKEAASLLAQGGSLFVFVQRLMEDEDPSGSIRDAAEIAWQASQKRADLLVIPVALFYDDAKVVGSNVEFAVGKPISPFFDEMNAQDLCGTLLQGLQTIEGRTSPSQMPQKTAELLALLASWDDWTSYTSAFYAILQLPVRSSVIEAWDVFHECCMSHQARTIKGFPLLPTQSLFRHITELLLSVFPVAANILLNFVPYLIVLLFSLLWKSKKTELRLKRRLFIGAAALLLWIPLFWVICWAYGLTWLALLHLCVSATGGYCMNVFKTNAVQLFNMFRCPEMKTMQARLQDELLSTIL